MSFMKRRLLWTTILTLTGGLAVEAAAGDKKSPSGGQAVKATVAAMIEAHGGMERWLASPAVSYKHTMVSPMDPDDPWVSIEITEQGSRREYQEWPLDKAVIAGDGKTVWSLGWKRANPPKFMYNLSYYFLNLPWITQDDGVRLEGPGEGTIPEDDKTYVTIKLTFDPGVGFTPDDYYVIYLDPETHLMRATEYIVTYGAMLDLMQLPPEMTHLGPLYHVYDEYTTVDGLVVPSKYKTYNPAGELYGEHTVTDWSFKKPFDEARMKMPKGAVIDESSAKRKAVVD